MNNQQGERFPLIMELLLFIAGTTDGTAVGANITTGSFAFACATARAGTLTIGCKSCFRKFRQGQTNNSECGDNDFCGVDHKAPAVHLVFLSTHCGTSLL